VAGWLDTVAIVGAASTPDPRWFREPTIPAITEADWRTLSDHAQQLTRHLVQLSSEELRTGWSFKPLGPFRAR
jgi:hypothetical protein